ncbi:MAG: hypothetical protein RR922_06115 [Clostridia bacterium]
MYKNIETINTKSVYVVFSHSGTIPSKVIKWFTGDMYSHVSISIDPTLRNLYSFARKRIYNPLNAGFVKENFTTGIFGRNFECVKCKVYEIKVTEEKYNNLCNIINEFKQNEDKFKYNLIGLMSPMTNIPIERNNHYFCSQFVSEALIKSEILNINKRAVLLTPKALENQIHLEPFFEGTLKQLTSVI